MKKGIHPTYNNEVEVHCICGANFNISSAAQGPIRIESCPSCHPAYTGKQETKVVKGRMERFMEKQKKIEEIQGKNKGGES